MPRRSILVTLLWIGTAVVAAAGIAALVVEAARGGEVSITSLAPSMLMLLLALGLALTMLAIARMLSRDPNDLPFELRRTLSQLQSQLADLTVRVNEARQASERAVNVQQSINPESPAIALTPSDLEPIYQGLREIRELTLLTDSERRERLQDLRRDRHATLVKQAFDLVAAREWHKAERVVLALETEFPNDDEVARGRSYLNHARKLHEQDTVARSITDIEELMSLSAWDNAHSRAQTLVDGFPDNPQARALLLRVHKERDAFQESTVHRMFDELRNDIDRRMWRRALLHAQHLLERFPTHARAEGVRRQLQTLADNAEIEQRQEMEVRIQELVRAQQIDEAIALGEEVIRRYPNSPQAESLDTLLPKLRNLAARAVNDFAGLVHEYDDEEPEHRLA